jgi:membrane associated rhomboid family serine protease
MSNLLYISGNFSRFWAIGFHPFSAGGIIHVLVCTIIAILLRLIRKKDYKISILVKIKKKNMKTDKVILGVLGGLAAGAIMGILFAPEKEKNKKEN